MPTVHDLQEEWRTCLDALVEQSVRLHSHADDDPARDDIAEHVDVLRHRLADVETALTRVEAS